MILLTAFNRFANLDVNASEMIVRSIARRARENECNDLVTEVLPTEYRRADERIRELIREIKPRAILGLGVAMGTSTLRLERVALNLDDSDVADNAGEVAAGRLIDPEGPAAYWSSLPLAEMLGALKERDVPAVISNHAGAFLCNHLFYVARHEVEQLGVPSACGFFHVPAMATGASGEDGLPLTLMVKGIEACLDLLRDGQSGTGLPNGGE